MKSLKFLIMGMLVFMFLSGCSQTTQVEESNEIEVGAILPLTGDVAAYGQPMQQIIELAVEEINSEGGVNGKNLKVIYEDGTCDAKGGATAAQKLVNINNVEVILGGLCSGETMGAGPVVEEGQVVLFSSASSSPDITSLGDYVFRNYPSDDALARAVAEKVIEDGYKKVVIVNELTDYAVSQAEVFKKTILENGGEIVLEESFASDETDYRSILAKVKNSDADAQFVISNFPPTFSLVLKQLSELEIDLPLYSNEMLSTDEVLEENKEYIEGAITALPKFDDSGEGITELKAKLEAKYGSFTSALPDLYTATMYDAVYILKESLEECGDDADCVKESLYSIEDRDGLAGTISMDENGDVEVEFDLFKIESGKAVLIE